MGTVDFLVMRLFPKVKMRRNGVLKEVNDKISGEHQNKNGIRAAEHRIRSPGAQLHGFGNHLDQRRREHEAGAQRYKIFQIPSRPLPMRDEHATQKIRRGRHNPEQPGQQNPHSLA